jgi:uncharacterized protein YuzE
MRRMEVRLANPEIDFRSLQNAKTFKCVYYEDEDVLFIRPSEPRPATSIDWEGEIWIRVDISTGEIVGLEIDDFEAVFLKKHPELAVAWSEVKPLNRCKKNRRSSDILWESFLQIILSFLKRFFTEHPQQIAFETMPTDA